MRAMNMIKKGIKSTWYPNGLTQTKRKSVHSSVFFLCSVSKKTRKNPKPHESRTRITCFHSTFNFYPLSTHLNRIDSLCLFNNESFSDYISKSIQLFPWWQFWTTGRFSCWREEEPNNNNQTLRKCNKPLKAIVC